MLIIFAVILGGILTGRLLLGRRLAFVQPLITGIIWTLLFLLGVEVGSDPAVAGGLATLGVTALGLFAFSVAGSILAAWGLWLWIRRRDLPAPVSGTNSGPTSGAAFGKTSVPASGPADDETPQAASSLWQTLKGSLVIVAFFAVGCLAGLWTEPDMQGSSLSTWVLYALMFCVGVTLGNDRTLAGRVRRLDRRLALLPVATAVGTLGGAALAAPFFGADSAVTSAADSLAVGAGFGYYSLSSIFIADLRGAELATVALLCNILRELFTLLAAPLVARWFGPLAAVSIGGATTFDTTLPIITRAAGRPYAVVSIFHGCVMDFSVPFLVTFFCSL